MTVHPNHLTGAVLAGTLLAVSALPAYATSTDVSINTASYVFASFDASGSSIANNIAPGGADGVTNNDVPFWIATTTFNVAAGPTSLFISDLGADDRAVVELNGTVVAAAGIYGPGAGMFIFFPPGPNVTQAFNGNGVQAINVTSGFITGLNTLEIIVNNTGSGIYGGLTGGPSSLAFSGVVTSVTGVPEPATWGLMLLGFGGLGAALRGRRGQVALTA